MSLAYARHLEECKRDGVEPATPEEFTRVDCSLLPSLTVQSEKDNCDINLIVAKFDQGQMVTHMARGVPTFGDVSEVGDFREALERVQKANEWFIGLPAEVRKAFSNDPAEFIDAFSDEKRIPELEKFGFVEKPVVAPEAPAQ